MDWTYEERRGQWERWRHRWPSYDVGILCQFPGAFVDGHKYLIFGRNCIHKVDAQGMTQHIYVAPGVGAGPTAMPSSLLSPGASSPRC